MTTTISTLLVYSPTEVIPSMDDASEIVTVAVGKDALFPGLLPGLLGGLQSLFIDAAQTSPETPTSGCVYY